MTLSLLMFLLVVPAGACQMILGIDGANPNVGSGSDAGADSIVTEEKIRAGDIQERGFFGFSVAIDGDTLIVSAGQDFQDKGSAYVFTRVGDVGWAQQAKLVASDSEAVDNFGFSVSIFENTAIIGAPGEQTESGAAYVFVSEGTDWTEQAKLTPDTRVIGARFGGAVAVGRDTALAGSSGTSSAFVSRRGGTAWAQEAELESGKTNDNFGNAVSLDTNTAVVGAEVDDTRTARAGAVYVYTRAATTWSLQAKLTASDAVINDDHFGFSVSLDGDALVVGSVFSGDLALNTGAAYVFTRVGVVWSESARLTASDAATGAQFGRSVDLDGDRLVVGGPTARIQDVSAGGAYVFEGNGATWQQTHKFTANDGEAEDAFGQSVSLFGADLVVGSPQDDDNFEQAGSAYIFSF